MAEVITQLSDKVLGFNVWLAVFLVAMVPLVELKGAIPFGMSTSIWGSQALSAWPALLMAFLGCMVVVPIIALIFKPIVTWLDKYKFFHTIISFFTADIRNRSDTINSTGVKAQHKNIKIIISKMLLVIIFVAFPIPLTGVWTGTCFAVLLGLNFWQTCLSTILGNFICGLIIIFICNIFPESTLIILYIFLALLVLALIIKIICHIVKKKQNKSM